MKPSTIGILILAGVLVLLGFTFLRAVQLDRAAYLGMACGAVLGGINILLGYKVTGRALEQDTVAALRTILTGFFVRMLTLVGLILYFHTQAWINETAFALSFLVFFCIFLALEVRMVQRSLNGPGRPA